MNFHSCNWSVPALADSVIVSACFTPRVWLLTQVWTNLLLSCHIQSPHQRVSHLGLKYFTGVNDSVLELSVSAYTSESIIPLEWFYSRVWMVLSWNLSVSVQICEIHTRGVIFLTGFGVWALNSPSLYWIFTSFSCLWPLEIIWINFRGFSYKQLYFCFLFCVGKATLTLWPFYNPSAKFLLIFLWVALWDLLSLSFSLKFFKDLSLNCQRIICCLSVCKSLIRNMSLLMCSLLIACFWWFKEVLWN